MADKITPDDVRGRIAQLRADAANGWSADAFELKVCNALLVSWGKEHHGAYLYSHIARIHDDAEKRRDQGIAAGDTATAEAFGHVATVLRQLLTAYRGYHAE